MPALSKKQQKFFGIVRSIQKGEQTPTTPETAKAAADMKKGDVKKFASTKHKGLPEKKVTKEAYGNPNVGPALKMARLIDKTKPGAKSKRTKISQYLKRREMEGDKKKYAAVGEEVKISEDKQVKKIVKQLRKSVKSHAKQADTLEKKLKEAKNCGCGQNPCKTFGKEMKEEKKSDHEPEMIRNQLKTAGRASKRIKKHTRKKDDFKAWVQSKITKASDYLDTAADYLDSKDMKEESNPRIPRKKGQPANSKKHSDLYTDENPKGTIRGLGFKDVATAKASVSKIRGSSRSHAHKIQAAVAMEQRAREMGKTSEAAVYRKFINTMKKKTKSMNEGSLHNWFKGSKSKDGKPGWVNVKTGGTCASDEPGEGTPKCVSSSKRASMSKSERDSASRRKKAADPGQQSKTGAAKPTYVSTDKPKKKMKEEIQITESDKKGKGSGSKDACYHKVKSRYSVWPSAYASGALVKCRKVGAANWGNSSKKEEFELDGISFQQFQEKCWKGYKKKGMKTMFGKRYPNCVKEEEVQRDEYGDPVGGPKISKKQKAKNLAMNEPDKQHTTDTSEEVIYERQKDSKNQRLSQERGRSNYGKTTIRNIRKFGTAGENPDPMTGENPTKNATRGELKNKRREEHKAKRGMKEEVKVPKNVKKIAKELDKAVALHASQAKRLRKADISEELTGWRRDLGYEDRDDSKKLLEDDMKGMSVKSGHKRPTKSGAGMTQKGVEAYRRRNPGSKLKTAVTTKPSKLKKGSKSANRRKSYCARSAGQMKKFPKAAKDPDSRLRQARRRWNC